MSDFEEEFGFLPAELVYKCHNLVKAFHAKHGSGKQFVAASMIASEDSPYLTEVMRKAVILCNTFKFFCFLALILSILAGLVSWWFLAPVVPIMIVAIAAYKRGEDQLVQQRALILAVEMLASDFADWGRLFPEAHLRAVLRRSDRRSELLDLYLPSERRTPDIAQIFAPSERSKALAQSAA
jgi:hypothetical protein